MKSSGKSISQLTVLKVAGAILGVGYSILQVQLFGTSRVIEVYFAAASILYVITSLAQGGQLAELFLPVYHKHFTKVGKTDADGCFGVVINRILLYVLPLTVIAVLVAPFLVHLIIPGFSADDRLLAIGVFRVLVLVFPLIVISGFMRTYLNANKIFGRAELAGLFSILISIFTLSLLYKYYGIWSVVIAFISGRLWEFSFFTWILLRNGYHHRIILAQAGFDQREFFKGMFATAGYSGATQLYNVALTAAISFLPPGVYAVFKYTQQFMIKIRGVIYQPLLTVFYTSYSLVADFSKNYGKNIVTKYIELIIAINAVTLMLVVSYGDTILRLLWGGSKFNPSMFHPAYILLTMALVASFILQIGGIYRKIAMSLGYGKLTYRLWTVGQLLTALITFILIALFSTQGLYFVILVNATILGGISFGLIYVRNPPLTKVYNFKDTMKWVITFIIVVPTSIYLNQLNWHVLMDIPRVNLAINLGVNLVLSSALIVVFVLLFKIEVRKYLYQMLPISLNKI